MSVSAAHPDRLSAADRWADRLACSALASLAIALVGLVWMVNRPGVPRVSPFLLYGSFIAPGAAAIVLSAAGLFLARRAGARTWLAATALRLSLGFAVVIALGALAVVLMLWRMAEALSSF
ncbi:hypothetical protein ACIGO9_18295 [Nocardia asteroides]|uniref:hypothetical protein n=1 Tax=Nocardia asteroides TaxID=1824 RepID=UPI0037CB7BBC